MLGNAIKSIENMFPQGSPPPGNPGGGGGGYDGGMPPDYPPLGDDMPGEHHGHLDGGNTDHEGPPPDGEWNSEPDGDDQGPLVRDWLGVRLFVLLNVTTHGPARVERGAFHDGSIVYHALCAFGVCSCCVLVVVGWSNPCTGRWLGSVWFCHVLCPKSIFSPLVRGLRAKTTSNPGGCS